MGWMVRSLVKNAVLFGAAFTLAACNLLSGTQSYRYRVTVEVETPEGIRTGSNVWEVKGHDGGGPDRKVIARERGEAVAIDLPGGTLFALLRSHDVNAAGAYAPGLVVGHLRRHPETGVAMAKDWRENMRRIADARPAFDLSPDEYPLLVRFRDLADPASIEKVQPDAMSAAFGNGVRVKRIGIAVTDDRPESRIYEFLPWLKTHRGALVKTVCEDRSNLPIQCRITDGDLRTGMGR